MKAEERELLSELSEDLGFAEWPSPEAAEEMLLGLIKKYYSRIKALLSAVPKFVQPAPSEEDAERIAMAVVYYKDRVGDPRPQAAFRRLRAQLAAAPQLQNYFDEECRLRREAETRAEKAEAQLAERTRDDESVEKILQYLKAELDRKDTVIKLVRERLDFARAALDGKEPPHA